MNGIRFRWRRFWFTPNTATDLAVSRIFCFGGLFFYYLGHDFSAWADVSPHFWKPQFVFRLLSLDVLPEATLSIAQVLWKASLLLSCLGLFTRPSTTAAFLGGFYLLGMQHGFSKLHHADAVVVLTFAVFAASRCGDRCSLDSWLQSKRHGVGNGSETSGEYTWPLQLVRFSIVMVFFAAGVSKLRHSGWEWTNPENLQALILHSYYHWASNEPLTSWGRIAAGFRWLMAPLAVATVCLEILSPLALFHRRARLVLVPLLVGFLVFVRLLMGPNFFVQLNCFVVWIPWERLIRAVRRDATSAPPPG